MMNETVNYLSVNNKEYHIIKLLGHGKGGYSYLAERDGIEYVLKQIHNKACDYYTFGNKIESERRDYQRLKSFGIRIPVMYDINTENERSIKEYINGATISELIENNIFVERYINQVLVMSENSKAAGYNIDNEDVVNRR